MINMLCLILTCNTLEQTASTLTLCCLGESNTSLSAAAQSEAPKSHSITFSQLAM